MTTRPRIALSLTTLGLTGLLGLTGCGLGGPAAPADTAGGAAGTAAGAPRADLAGFTDEVGALQMVGFDQALGLTTAPGEGEEPAPAESGAPAAGTPSTTGEKAGEQGEGRRGARGVRRFLRKNTLHAEVTVQGKEGRKTILAQRGTVTEADGKAFTVKSADGFTLTWRPDETFRVIQDKKKVGADAVRQGTQVGIAGLKQGEAAAARLVVITG